MRRNKLWLLAVSLVFILAFGAQAQKSKTQKPVKKPAAQKSKVDKPALQKSKVQKTVPKSKTQSPAQNTKVQKPAASTADASGDEQKVKDLISFLQLLLNTLGSNSTSARDKDVVITESYNKIFQNSKVHIEDDLDEDRKAITNKDVVAYLKDVDFFFQDAKFEFTIEDIKGGVNSNGQVFYKVSLQRNLTGITANGKSVNNTIPRFVEINYNPESADLKIASIYTNEFDEKEALTNWWRALSFEWKTIFKKKLSILTDSVDLDNIKDITAIDEIDLSNNFLIQTTEPLSQLVNLKLLNLAHTGIADLTPIRNLTELVEVNLSHTKIFDLTPLKYASKLARLNINNTEIRSIAVVEKMPELQNLQMRHTQVIDFAPLSNLPKLLNLDLGQTQIPNLSPISNLVQLMELNVSATPVADVSPIKGFNKLVTLTIDSTQIRDITTLSTLTNLEVLFANYTRVADLHPLLKLEHLERIYCDQTSVNKKTADAFIAANPRVLVVFDSKDLKAWWDALSPEWQTVLSHTAKIGLLPAKEELAKVTNIDSINFSNQASIQDLEPLRKLQKLRVIIANNTPVEDLSPLKDHRQIRYLDISDTQVNDLSAASQFTKLEVLRADRSKIEKLDPIYSIKALKELYVDRTTLHDITAREFLEKNPTCLLVYKTIHLDRWWTNLPEEWKQVFRSLMAPDTTSSRENLHRLVEREEFHFKDARVHDLSGLSEFVRLKELHFSGTPVSEIPALENLNDLRSLHATNSPLQRIGAINQLSKLEDLDISNTPIDDLRGIESLQQLKSFNCAGTQVKKLDPLKGLEALQSVDCSNTNVGKLDPVAYRSLLTLKCYNTKVSGREIEKFKENNPDCNVVYYR